MSYEVGQMVRVLGTPWAGKVKLVDTAHNVVMLDVWREHGPDERYEDAPYHFDEIEAAPDLSGPPHKHEWVKVVGGLAQCHCGSTIGSPLVAGDPLINSHEPHYSSLSVTIVPAPSDRCGNTKLLPDGTKCPGCRACC